MLRFVVQGGTVVHDPTLMMIQEFTDIIEKNKSNKELANKMLLYVFFCCDLTNANPLRDIPYSRKEAQAWSRAFGKNVKKLSKKNQDLIDAGIDAYNYFNEDALERAGLVYDRQIDEMSNLLDHTTPKVHLTYEEAMCETCIDLQGGEEINEVRTPKAYVSNDKIIANFMKQLNEAAIFKLKAIETAKKIENTGRVRGNKGSSMVERGVFLEEADKKTLESQEDGEE